MGTKNTPGKYDCYENAEPDEPMFILLGRDPVAPALVQLWSIVREAMGTSTEKVLEARQCAAQMRDWARQHVSKEKFEASREARESLTRLICVASGERVLFAGGLGRAGAPWKRRLESEEIDGVDSLRDELTNHGPPVLGLEVELWQTAPEERLLAVLEPSLYSMNKANDSTVLLLAEHQVGVLNSKIAHCWRLRMNGSLVMVSANHSYRIISEKPVFTGVGPQLDTPARYQFPAVAYFQYKTTWGEWDGVVADWRRRAEELRE